MSDFCGSFGINTKFGFAPSGAIGAAVVAPNKRIEILSENLSYTDQIVGGQGITGSVDTITGHLREGARLVRGGFVTEIGPNELDPWIHALVGNNAAEQTKETIDMVPHDLTVLRDLVCHAYRYCIVESARIRCQSDPDNPENQVMKLAISFLGVEEVSTTFPVLALPAGNRYFWLMGDTTFEYAEAALPVIDFDLRIQNSIQPLFRNLLKPGCFRSTGREITLDVSVPYSATSATALFGSNAENQSAVLTMGAANLPVEAEDYETVFTLGSTRRISKAANTDGRDEIPLRVRLKAYQEGANPALTIANQIVAA